MSSGSDKAALCEDGSKIFRAGDCNSHYLSCTSCGWRVSV